MIANGEEKMKNEILINDVIKELSYLMLELDCYFAFKEEKND